MSSDQYSQFPPSKFAFSYVGEEIPDVGAWHVPINEKSILRAAHGRRRVTETRLFRARHTQKPKEFVLRVSEFIFTLKGEANKSL